LKNKLQT